MTFEKKCFITPADILAARFKCVNCGAITTIPLNKLTSANLQSLIHRACQHCQTPSGFGLGTAETDHFLTFNVALSRMAEVLKGRNLEYGFEIDCPKDGE